MPKFSELLAVLTGKLLLPIICELDNETGNPIAIKLVVACDGKREVIELYSRTVNDSVESSGEVRVNVKQGHDINCYNFSLESIFNGVAPGTGFSGMEIRGKLTFENVLPELEITARINRYNVWGWGSHLWCQVPQSDIFELLGVSDVVVDDSRK